MKVTAETVRREREWVLDRSDRVTALINEVRIELGDRFDVEVASIEPSRYRAEVDEVFDEVDVAVNVAALIGLLRDLDVHDDYPGFVIDELLGRELAGTIAGGQPLRLLAEATFHYADIYEQGAADDTAGLDDLDAALAAGFQTRLPGWPWRESTNPFDP